MPSLQGTKTIALGTRSAMLIVSWAAPECIAMYGSPVAFTAVSRAVTTSPSSGAGDRIWRCLYSTVMPRSPAALSAKVAMSRATPRKASSSTPRMSREKRASPGTALMRPGFSSISPTVPTVPPPASRTRRSRSSVVAAAVDHDIGVDVACDGVDEADTIARVLQDARLLDVQLDPAVQVVEDLDRLSPASGLVAGLLR